MSINFAEVFLAAVLAALIITTALGAVIKLAEITERRKRDRHE